MTSNAYAKAMKSSFHTLFVSALLVLTALSLVRADTPLEEKMDEMKVAFRGLRTALEAPVDTDREKYVALADELRAASVAAKEYEPSKTRSVPEDKRAEFLAGYRQSMDDLVALVDQLKTQLAAGQWDAAREQIKLIGQAQRDGHKEFRSTDD